MAYIFVDGCDSYSTAASVGEKFDIINAVVGATDGRFGGIGLRTGSAVDWIQVTKQLPPRASAAGVDDLYVGWSYKQTSTVGSKLILAATNRAITSTYTINYTVSPTTLILDTTASGIPRLMLNNVQIAVGTTVLTTGTWYRFELKLSIHNTAGIAEFRINGVPEITYAGDTFGTGEALLNSLTWFGGVNDDFIVWDSIARGVEPTTWIGDVRIETLRPSADGDSSDSTPNTGSRWDAVNDVGSDGDTTYTSATVIGSKDYYTCTNLADVPTTIHGVVVNSRWKTMGTTGRKGKLRIKSGGVEEAGPVTDIYTGLYGNVQSYFPQDPATSAAWDSAGVDGLQIGWDLDT